MTMAIRTTIGQGLRGSGTTSEEGDGCASQFGRPRDAYAIEQVSRPATITGIERSRSFRRPTVSMMRRAMRVQMKFVSAIESEVRVGEVNPRRENMVAEKYINEFYIDMVSPMFQRRIER